MLLKAHSLSKTYHRGEQPVHALRGVNLSIQSGEFIAVMGPSGSGKSTLLHIMGGLDRPTSGSVTIDDKPIEKLTDYELSIFRRRHLGFIFQFFNLLPTLSALENVMLPCMLDGKKSAELESRAESLLTMVGLKSRLTHRPNQLSGGEMQRVAVARALISNPYLILADEPTGNLDSKTGNSVLELLRDLVKTQGHTIVMVTHDKKAASYGTRLIQLKDGQVELDQENYFKQVEAIN